MSDAIRGPAESQETHAASLALVDFASICPSGGEPGHADALDLLAVMIRARCGWPSALRSTVHEVDCRIYGGFRDVAGSPTESRVWLTKHLARARGLKDGIRVVPVLVEAIACAPARTLIGTIANGRQKMVDAMIAEDLSLFARSGEHRSIMLISDDEDFVPVVLSVSRTTPTEVRWLRQRAVGRNDRHFEPSVTLLTDARWR
jgi:hypothetical protein